MTAQLEWLIALALLGFVLICAEIFVPGMVLGILGGLCLMGAVCISFSVFGTTGGIFAIASLLLLAAFLAPAWIKLGPRTKIGRKLTLDSSEKSFQSASDLQRFAGKTGTTQSILRPSGIATIEGERVDVVSETGHIAAGKSVRVARIEGARIVVEEVRAS